MLFIPNFRVGPALSLELERHDACAARCLSSSKLALSGQRWQSDCRLGLNEPERHPHLAVHRRRSVNVFLRATLVPGLLVILAETEMAVRGERAQLQLIGKRQCLPIVRFGFRTRGFSIASDLA